MDHILQSEIFFFITSIFVIILTTILVIAGFYIIKALRNFSDISTTLKNTVNDTSGELAEMAGHVRDSFLFKLIFGDRKKKNVHQKK